MTALIAAAAACPLVVDGPATAAPRAQQSTADKPWLGVVMSNGIRGVQIAEVVPGTPAEHAGLRPGDEIETINGERTKTQKEMQTVIAGQGIGDSVTLKVHRGRQVLTLDTELSQFLDPRELFQRWHLDQPAPHFITERVAGPHDVDLRAHQGKVVIVYFGTSACETCIEDYRELAALQAANRDELVVLSISQEVSKKLTQSLGSSITLAADRHGRVTRQLFRVQQDHVAAVVVGRDGHIRFADSEAGRLGLRDTVDAAKLALREHITLW